MAQLTGNFQGSAEADVFSGSISADEQTVIDNVGTGIAVKQVVIDTFAGADTLEAKTQFGARSLLAANGIGMTTLTSIRAPAQIKWLFSAMRILLQPQLAPAYRIRL
jgi:hypothetical protein